MELSYSGRNFYDRARGIIEAVKTATKTLNENYSFPSIIKIGVVHSALRNILFTTLKKFNEIEPRCKVQIIERSSNNVVDSVLGGECDFGINYVLPTPSQGLILLNIPIVGPYLLEYNSFQSKSDSCLKFPQRKYCHVLE